MSENSLKPPQDILKVYLKSTIDLDQQFLSSLPYILRLTVEKRRTMLVLFGT